jgi:16S rRNA (adenine1518-N6/adenine1519-N6)-dimethyltransferase
MRLSEIRPLLSSLGIDPSTSMGQNFLHDRNLANWMVQQLGVQPGEWIVEVGPGLGALTEWLLEAGARVLAIEKDARLAAYLEDRFRGRSLEVCHADALDFDLRSLWPKGVRKWIGNLPYYVSSQILFHFSGALSPAKQGIIMVQREMAERLCAKPGSRDYGLPSVLLGLRWRMRQIKKVSPGLFLPAPRVESGIIELTQKEVDALPVHDGARVAELARAGFGQRRKQLRKTLAPFVGEMEAFLESHGLPGGARPEDLSVDQWIDLSRWDTGKTEMIAQRPDEEIFDVVNENDEVVGRKSRHDVHVNNLRHRAVHVFIFNQAGELFLQKRSAWKDRHPGVWDSSAAGHLDAGEEYDACARREVREELGLEATVVPIARIPASENTGWEFVGLYRGQAEGPFKLPAAEIETGAFFPSLILDRWTADRPEDFAPGFLECYRAYRETVRG